MAKVRLRQKAIDDLNSIWKYTFYKWSENQADKYYNLLKTACLNLENHSNLGKEYKRIELGLFGLKIGKHIIFYQSTAQNDIEVVRILHERMDLKKRLKE